MTTVADLFNAPILPGLADRGWRQGGRHDRLVPGRRRQDLRGAGERPIWRRKSSIARDSPGSAGIESQIIPLRAIMAIIARSWGKPQGFQWRRLSRVPFGRNFRPNAARPSHCGRDCSGKWPALPRKSGANPAQHRDCCPIPPGSTRTFGFPVQGDAFPDQWRIFRSNPDRLTY